jgi:hypothetical protein
MIAPGNRRATEAAEQGAAPDGRGLDAARPRVSAGRWAAEQLYSQ